MSNSTNDLRRNYELLVEFLGKALGPDYEVALHDLTDKNRSIVAIANGHVSGRSVGAPLTNVALGILKDKSYETRDYMVHYAGVTINGKDLRSSTMFIKENGKLVGMLCINFDDSRYHALSQQILALCHPDGFDRDARPSVGGENGPVHTGPETFRNSTEAVTIDAINRELDKLGVPADRLTSDERLHIIANLEAGGIFLLKGSVKDVAVGLNCSQASVYRYLGQIRDGK